MNRACPLYRCSHLLAKLRRLQPLPLPHDVVGVLDRQLRHSRVFALQDRVVEQAEIAHNHAVGPAVANDVVQRDHQGVMLKVKVQQLRPQDRRLRQRQRAHRLRHHLLLQAFFPQLDRHRGQVLLLKMKPDLRRYDLFHLVVDPGKARPQRLVPHDHRLQRLVQSLHVERPLQLQRQRDVQRRVSRHQLVHHPEPLLADPAWHDEFLRRGRRRRRRQQHFRDARCLRRQRAHVVAVDRR
jgi:hypothetical protein